MGVTHQGYGLLMATTLVQHSHEVLEITVNACSLRPAMLNLYKLACQVMAKKLCENAGSLFVVPEAHVVTCMHHIESRVILEYVCSQRAFAVVSAHLTI